MKSIKTPNPPLVVEVHFDQGIRIKGWRWSGMRKPGAQLCRQVPYHTHTLFLVQTHNIITVKDSAEKCRQF